MRKLKLVQSVSDDFNDVVDLFEDAVMIDYKRVKGANSGSATVEDENSSGYISVTRPEIIANNCFMIVKAELEELKSGQEYDVITIIRPRPIHTIEILDSVS